VNWIVLVPPSSPDYKIEFEVKAPEVKEDLKCKVELTISDKDRRKPLELTKAIDVLVTTVKPVKYTSDMQPTPEILQKYTLNSTAAQAVSAKPSNEPPVVIKQQMSLAGQAVIRFSEEIAFVDEVLSLSSENLGPLFFNITLIVN